MIETMFQEKLNTYYISEPDFFLKTCGPSFTLEQFHWFIQLWKKRCNTLQGLIWPLFSSVMWPILTPFISFLIFFSFCPDFITIIVVDFFNKTIILLSFAGYRASLII